ncbi:hypothetical protein HGRIS_014802 [Hohenbuehelia grisea]|uniref:Uncharacterized protein n=1 Tax=Hohenbuehelia grisea TaxID=104357 RepID=A0ABR3IQT5_9AGAR
MGPAPPPTSSPSSPSPSGDDCNDDDDNDAPRDLATIAASLISQALASDHSDNDNDDLNEDSHSTTDGAAAGAAAGAPSHHISTPPSQQAATLTPAARSYNPSARIPPYRRIKLADLFKYSETGSTQGGFEHCWSMGRTALAAEAEELTEEQERAFAAQTDENLC